MPDTEAGKRHRTLLRWRGDVPCRTCGKPHDYRWEGYRSTYSTWADPVDGHHYERMNAAEAVAAERARIRAAVEGLEAKASGEIRTGTCYSHQQWGCATCRPMQWEPDGDATLSRAAVLAIIDAIEAEAREGEFDKGWAKGKAFGIQLGRSQAIDEERLARAMHRKVCGVTTHRNGFVGMCRPWKVAAIAKAYREDTDADRP